MCSHRLWPFLLRFDITPVNAQERVFETPAWLARILTTMNEKTKSIPLQRDGTGSIAASCS